MEINTHVFFFLIRLLCCVILFFTFIRLVAYIIQKKRLSEGITRKVCAKLVFLISINGSPRRRDELKSTYLYTLTLFSSVVFQIEIHPKWVITFCINTTMLKGTVSKFSKFNPSPYGSYGLRIYSFNKRICSFNKFHCRIRSQMSKIGCARAVRLRQRAYSPVFALSAIPIYTQVCNIKGQISARV